MNTQEITYQQILLRELQIRRRRNPNYSLRAFARDLQMPAPKLSQALRGLKGISKARAVHISRSLALSPAEGSFFVHLVERDHGRSALVRASAAASLREASDTFSALNLEKFKIISTWYHFAILELSEVRDFESNSKWISQRLGISVEEATAAIARLLDVGLFFRTPEGELQQTEIDLAIPGEIPSREVREQHSQLLHKADQALESVPMEERDFSAITLAISSADLPLVKNQIRKFRRQLNGELQNAAEKDRVYSLCIQFFPLDQRKPKLKSNQKKGFA